jgi:thioredoxin reductase (NADPH)
VRLGRPAGSSRAQARHAYPFETSRPGVFAAGDVRYGSVKRVGGAVGSVYRYLAASISSLKHAAEADAEAEGPGIV